MKPSILLLLLSLLHIQTTFSLSFGTKIIQGSSCFHNLETGLPFSFGHGYLSHLVHTSKAVHLTKRHIRFILPYQTLVSPLERGWTQVPCHLAGHQHGSLCSIPSTPSTTTTSDLMQADLLLNITSNNTASNITYQVGYILSQEYSQVLPCPLFSQYTPSITSNGSILPKEYNAFMEAESNMCATSESSSVRNVVPSPQGHMYDITQCDLHDSSLSMVYIKSEHKIYLSSQMEVLGLGYWLCGLCIVVLMACLSQEIVSLLNGKSQKAARGDICLATCIASLVLVTGTGASHLQIFLTLEETIAFWWMVIYCSLRILWTLWQALASFAHEHTWKAIHSSIMHQTYYNLLVTSMMLLASRVHMTVDTPYTIGLSLLLGIRMFLKVYEGYDFDELSSIKDGNRAFRQVVVLGDSVLMMVMLQAGGITQFENIVDAQACVIVLVFSCICIARGVFEYNLKISAKT